MSELYNEMYPERPQSDWKLLMAVTVATWLLGLISLGLERLL